MVAPRRCVCCTCARRGSVHAAIAVAVLARVSVARIFLACMIMFLVSVFQAGLCNRYATTCILCASNESRIVDSKWASISCLPT